MQLPQPVNAKVQRCTQTTDEREQGAYTHGLYPHTDQNTKAPFLSKFHPVVADVITWYSWVLAARRGERSMNLQYPNSANPDPPERPPELPLGRKYLNEGTDHRLHHSLETSS